MMWKDELVRDAILTLGLLMLVGGAAGAALYGWRGFVAGACVTFVFMNGTAQT